MRITGAQVFDPRQGFVSKDLCIEGENIAQEASDPVSAQGCYLSPGLTDLHFHGCVGEDFSDGDAEGLARIAAYELSRGVTQICPAGMTLLEDQLSKICAVAAAHRAAGVPGAELAGVHLEGPFLCAAKKGAQNGAWLHDPDLPMLRRLQEAAQGLVKLVTVAPEQPGAMEFIRGAVEDGIVVSIGHTTADYDTACAAMDAGASHCTHLFNAMPPFTHRAPGVIGAASDHPGVRVELICDGIHIHPSVVRTTFRLFGAGRVVLISDSLRAAGMPDGQYPFGGQEIVVKGPRATLAHDPNTLAGSVTDLMGCLKTAVSFGIPLADAVTAAAVNPAKVLGIYDRVGSLDVGKTANLAVLDQHLELKAVLFHGNVVAGSL